MNAERAFVGILLVSMTVGDVVIPKGTLVTFRMFGKSYIVTLIEGRFNGLTFYIGLKDAKTCLRGLL